MQLVGLRRIASFAIPRLNASNSTNDSLLKRVSLMGSNSLGKSKLIVEIGLNGAVVNSAR